MSLVEASSQQAVHLRDKLMQQYNHSRCCLMITWQSLSILMWSVIFCPDCAACQLMNFTLELCLCFLREIICFFNGLSECFRKAIGKSSWCHYIRSLSLSLESPFISVWWVWLHHITSSWAQFKLESLLQVSVLLPENNNVTKSWITC